MVSGNSSKFVRVFNENSLTLALKNSCLNNKNKGNDIFII